MTFHSTCSSTENIYDLPPEEDDVQSCVSNLGACINFHILCPG